MMRSPKVLELIARSARLRQGALAIGPGGTPLGKPGHGLDFAEVRSYCPGDDVRHLDPRSSARLGKPYVKRFEPDGTQPIWILLDGSPSLSCMMSTEPTRWDQARELAMVITWCADRLGESIGLWVWGEKCLWIPPASHRSQTAQILVTLRASAGESHTAFWPQDANTANDPRWLLRQPSSLCLILSDWLRTEPLNWAAILVRRHDVRAVQFLDPWEIEGPPPGLYRFRDAETGRVCLVDAGTDRFHRSYREQAERRRDELSRQLAALGIPLDRFRTDRWIEHTPNQLVAWNHRDRLIPSPHG